MKVILSAAVTNDGYMDDLLPDRLILSDKTDLQEVHALRAQCDAILAGAETIRRDNPSFVIRDEAVRLKRVEAGMPADLVKVTVSASGDIDPDARFFTERPEARKIVILRRDTPKVKAGTLENMAEVIILDEITAENIIKALSDVGISSLMVEGGAMVLKMFFDEMKFDELRLAVAPFMLDSAHSGAMYKHADPDRHAALPVRREAPRLPYFGNLPFEYTADRIYRKVGRMNVIEYISGGNRMQTDREYLQRAIDISRRCRNCVTAYSVGCVITTSDGRIFEGYTHETGRSNHAEEEAILKAGAAGVSLKGASIYTSMEPCSKRASKPVSCCELIMLHEMGKVVYAYAEPDCFVCCDSTRMLREAGMEVVIPAGMEDQVIEINSHIIR